MMSRYRKHDGQKVQSYTMGDAIRMAKRAARINQKSCKEQHRHGRDQTEERGHRCDCNPEPSKDIIACLTSGENEHDVVNNLCTSNLEDEYEKIAVMIDSGASETVAPFDRFPSYQMIETTASGTTYSSAAEHQGGSITNVGEKFVEVVDENGTTTWAKFQMCKGLGQDKILGSVSRLVQAGHTVVFRDPELGSYIQNNTNGYKTYLRQYNGSYYLDLWVKKAQGHVQMEQGFPRQGN